MKLFRQKKPLNIYTYYFIIQTERGYSFMAIRIESHKKRREMYKPHDFIGKNLQLLRRMNDLSQDTIAAALNISRSSYRSLEAGSRIPSLETACALSEYYGISLEILIAFDISEYILSLLRISPGKSEAVEFMDKYMRLSHGAKQQIRSRISELHSDEFDFNNFPWDYGE